MLMADLTWKRILPVKYYIIYTKAQNLKYFS